MGADRTTAPFSGTLAGVITSTEERDQENLTASGYFHTLLPDTDTLQAEQRLHMSLGEAPPPEVLEAIAFQSVECFLDAFMHTAFFQTAILSDLNYVHALPQHITLGSCAAEGWW